MAKNRNSVHLSGQNVTTLNNLELRLEYSSLQERLRFSPLNNVPAERIQTLYQQIVSAANPRAVYLENKITAKNQSGLKIDGYMFSNYLLKTNLEKASRLFSFCTSLGDKIASMDSGPEDFRYLLKIMLPILKESVLKALQKNLMERYHFPYIWSLVTGEMQAWPDAGNHDLFRLLNQAPGTIGVQIQADSALSPDGSQAGFLYYADTEFEGCQVCSKEPCMMRRAQYNPELAAQKGLRIRRVCGKGTD
jgi:hypothetical protein